MPSGSRSSRMSTQFPSGLMRSILSMLIFDRRGALWLHARMQRAAMTELGKWKMAGQWMARYCLRSMPTVTVLRATRYVPTMYSKYTPSTSAAAPRRTSVLTP